MIKYERWYQQIVCRARARRPEVGMERHHIVPKSLGGTDNESNIVSLTYREHFLAHWLLTKCYAGEAQRKMHFALAMLCRSSKQHDRPMTSWQYAIARAKFHAAQRGRTVSLETRNRMSESARNRGPEYALKMSLVKMGVPITEGAKGKLREFMKNIPPEVRARMDDARRGFKHKPETIQRMRDAHTGRQFSDAHRAALSEAGKRRGKSP